MELPDGMELLEIAIPIIKHRAGNQDYRTEVSRVVAETTDRELLALSLGNVSTR